VKKAMSGHLRACVWLLDVDLRASRARGGGTRRARAAAAEEVKLLRAFHDTRTTPARQRAGVLSLGMKWAEQGKGMTVAEVEKWLSPNLAYEPKR